MLTWKNPIAIAFASVGVIVGFALPQHSLGQANVLSRNANEQSGDFAEDPLPLSATDYPGSQSTDPVTESIDKPDSSFARQINPLPPTQDFLPNQHVLESNDLIAPAKSLPSRSTNGLPTVIVRPPANDSRALNDLIVNIEQIAGSDNQEFAVRLTVPDSVKIIDVTPSHNSNSSRNFQIRIEQQLNQQPGPNPHGRVASTYSMPEATLIRSASSLNSVQPNQRSQLLMPSVQRQTIPVIRQPPTRTGFKKNPFFQPDDSYQPLKQQPTKAAPKITGLPVVIETMDPPPILEIDHLRSEQASYHTNSTDFSSTRGIDGAASQLSYTTSVEKHSAIHTAMFGPDKMRLGDFGDFMIYVNNPTTTTINDITVQLELPAGFDLVVLDRTADIDPIARTLTWNFGEVAPEQEHFICYRLISQLHGTQNQRIWFGSRHTARTARDLDTDVQVEFELEEDAPPQPFESN